MNNKQFRFPKKIKYLKGYPDNTFFACDTSNTFYWFNYPQLKHQKLLTTRYPSSYDSPHHVDCDETKKNIVCIHSQLNKMGLFHWDAPRETMIFSWHLSDIEVVKLSPDGRYLCSGDVDGYSYLWNTSTGRVIAILPRHHDYVSAISYDPEGRQIAIGSYDKTITITNLISLQGRSKIQGFSHAIAEIFFLSHSTIACIEKRDFITIWDFHESEIVKKFDFDGAFITCATLSADKEYLFVGTINQGIKVIDLLENVVLSFESVEAIKDPVTSLCYLPQEKMIVYTTDDRKMGFVSLLDDLMIITNQLEQLLSQRHFFKAYKLFLSHPFLRQTPLFDTYNEEWELTLYKAEDALEEGEVETARHLLFAFQNIPDKQPVINQLLNEYRKFSQFKRAYNDNNLPLFYALATSFPLLRHTIFFKEIEQKWNEGLHKIGQLISSSSKNIKDVVLEVIAPFQGTKEKMDVFHLLLKQFDLFVSFHESFAKKDFKNFFNYCDAYPMLKNFPQYESALNIGKNFLSTAHSLIHHEKFEETKRYISTLKLFPMYIDEATKIEEEIKLSVNFQRHILNKEYLDVYTMIDTHPHLIELDSFVNLEREIDYRFRKCEVFVSKGDIEGITSIVKEFYPIAHFAEKIRSFYTSAYSTQFMVELTINTPDSHTLNASISHYLSLFGLDDTITVVAEHIKRRTGFVVNLKGAKPRYDTFNFATLQLPDFII